MRKGLQNLDSRLYHADQIQFTEFYKSWKYQSWMKELYFSIKHVQDILNPIGCFEDALVCDLNWTDLREKFK